MNKDKSQIISFDSQGWPLYKQNIRDILIEFGLTHNKETNKWEIYDNDPKLDTSIITLVDDGMGYGINEEYITECNCFQDENGEYHCTMFREKKMNDIELQIKSKYE